MAKVAVMQMVSGADYETNLKVTEQLVAEAVAGGAELALLPENFAVFRASELINRGRQEQTADGPIRGFMAELARRQGLWLVAGSVPILSEDGRRVRSASLVYDDQGEERARYDKLHLFDVAVEDAQGAYLESAEIEPGDQLVVIDTPVGRLGLSICYDLRFPLLYQSLRDQGAELISVPAAFTQVTGEAHWEVLLRARAIETQSFVLAANQGGQHTEKRTTYGHSMIVDPWGRMLAQRQAAGAGVVLADIDLEQLRQVRRRMPVAAHKRPL